MYTSHIADSQTASKPPPTESPSTQLSKDTSLSLLGPTVDPRDDDAASIELDIHPITEKLIVGDEISYYSLSKREHQRAWIMAIDPELEAPLRLSTAEVLYKNDSVCLIHPRPDPGSKRCPLTRMFRIEQFQTKKEGDWTKALRQSLEIQKNRLVTQYLK